MTTPDYQPRRSPEDGDATEWPVTAEDGAAIDPWERDDDSEPSAADDEVEEILLDAPVDPWDIEAEPDEEQTADFPLDAFIVPAGVRQMPSGYDEQEVARRVALRLDELADELRSSGLAALGATAGTDELSRVLAAIVTGYVARET